MVGEKSCINFEIWNYDITEGKLVKEEKERKQQSLDYYSKQIWMQWTADNGADASNADMHNTLFIHNERWVKMLSDKVQVSLHLY